MTKRKQNAKKLTAKEAYGLWWAGNSSSLYGSLEYNNLEKAFLAGVKAGLRKGRKRQNDYKNGE